MTSQRWHRRISTHTSRVGCDVLLQQERNGYLYFYSHIPCGMWLIPIEVLIDVDKFLLTHPVWDVTGWLASQADMLAGHFYSHIPCGMWPIVPMFGNKRHIFLLTHPVWDVTFIKFHESTGAYNFYSHIPCGMWLNVVLSRAISYQFLLTHPVWDVTEHATVVSRATRISTHTSRVGCDQRSKARG